MHGSVISLRPWLAALLLVACGGDENPVDDLCLASDVRAIVLGRGVGGAFVPYQDEEEVGLSVAPQGGFGVTVIIQTQGLTAGVGELASVELDTEMGGTRTGTFLLAEAPLLCRSDGTGGMISGVVVGFDPDVYSTNDDLLQLDGQVVDLVVTVTDSGGHVASTRQPVTIQVGA
jgi:hypothetical protein